MRAPLCDAYRTWASSAWHPRLAQHVIAPARSVQPRAENVLGRQCFVRSGPWPVYGLDLGLKRLDALASCLKALAQGLDFLVHAIEHLAY